MPTEAPVAPDIDIGIDHDEHDEHAKLFNVVLLDDDEHTYDYVIEMLQSLFFMGLEQAYHHACEVDAAKRTVIMTCELEPAEFAKNQIHSFGADWRMPESRGSMTAIIEPAAQS